MKRNRNSKGKEGSRTASVQNHEPLTTIDPTDHGRGPASADIIHVLESLQALRDGDFSARLPGSWTGLSGKLADTFNEIAAANQQIATELERVGQAVGKQGKTSERARFHESRGAWGEMSVSINSLVEDLLRPTEEVTRAIAAVAHGNLNQRLRLDVNGRPLEGEFLVSANIVNTMIQQLGVFAAEVTRVAREVGTDGKLGGQAVVSGAAGTWKDLTDSVNLMASNLTGQVRNIAEVATAVASGDLSRKITVDVSGEILQLKEAINTMVDQLRSFASEVTRVAREVGTEGKLGGQAVVPYVAGTWKDLTDSVNAMASNLTAQVRNIAEVTTAVARGDLSRKITVDVKGEILELKDTVNTMVDQLNAFAEEVTRVAREVGTEGKLGGQAKVPGVGGTWKDLTDNVNFMASNLTGQVRNIADVATAIANGNLSRKITVDVRGEILQLKETLNTMVDQLNRFAGEVTRVAREVGTEGKLGGQADVPRVAGTWKDLTDSVNSMAGNLTAQVRNIAEVTTAVARGDLSRKITADVKGELLELKNTINTMVDQLNAFAAEVTRVAKEVGTDGKLGGQAQVRGVAGTWKDLTDNVNVMAANLTEQVRGIVKVVTAVADGDLTQTLTVNAKGEVAALAETINNMTRTLATFADQVTTVAHEVGVEGRLGGQARVPGAAGTWKDLTGNVNLLANNLTNQVRAIAEVATAVTKGDLTRSIKVEASGELVELKDNINTMIHNLRLTTEHNTEQDWLKSNLARVTGMLQGQRDLATVGEMLLSQLVPLVNAQQGVIYKVEEVDSSLALLSSFAGHRGAGNGYAKRVKKGEGLVGQCAAERRSMLITDIPPNAVVPIRSGILRALPRSVMVLPVLFEGRLKAVIELASLNSFTKFHLAFLEQLSSTVGIVLNSIEATMQTEALLKQSQELATELQARQGELQHTNEQLGQKAQQLAEQNAEVERKNKEIEQARFAVEEKAKELAITSKYKSDFLANMSHELRTPLNSILVLGQQLSGNPDGNLTEKQVEFARTIHAAGTDLLNLITDILDLSKIESGTVSVEAGEVVFTSLLEAVARPFRHEAEEKRLSFDVHVDPQLPHTMVTDSKRLQQILKNLLSNAFKFTEKGGISLSAYPVKKAPNGKSEVLGSAEQVVAFEVTDTGIGIPVEKQRTIFEAFQQADAGTSRRYGGTGLGLAISRELAGLLGGEIQLQSTPGGGSTFTLYLPLRHQTVASPSRVSAPTKNVVNVIDEKEPVDDDRDAIQTGDLVLLIIEDDPHFARLLCDLSRDNGFRVLLASRGADGLELAHRFHPTAISLDVFLPDMLGWTVLNHLKQDPDMRHIPVQMLTLDEDRRHGLSRGAFAFVTKPAPTKKLEEALARIKDYVPRRKRLLVVEDNPLEQFSIRRLLDHDDIDVVVGRGADALRALKEQIIDCVVLDLRLPDMSGIDLLERLSENTESSDVPVVVFTGKVLSVEEDARLRMLARSVIVKRVESPERLLDETALFLHRLMANLPAEKQALLEQLHRSDEALVGKKVLVVDDDVRNIFAVASVLERHGTSVVTAETGQEALAKIASNPDMAVVLMDIMMPGMDGYETIRTIRQTVSLGRLPIIALTAKAMKGDREKCIDAGASEYLAKPVNTEQLLSMLRTLLHR